MINKDDLLYLGTIMINGIIDNTDGFYEEKRSYIFEGD